MRIMVEKWLPLSNNSRCKMLLFVNENAVKMYFRIYPYY